MLRFLSTRMTNVSIVQAVKCDVTPPPITSFHCTSAMRWSAPLHLLLIHIESASSGGDVIFDTSDGSSSIVVNEKSAGS